MIVDIYLKKISDESGRREITSSMVKEARKAYKAFRSSMGLGKMAGHLAYLAAQQSRPLSREEYVIMAHQQANAQSYNPYGLAGLGGMGSLGSICNPRCSCCGR